MLRSFMLICLKNRLLRSFSSRSWKAPGAADGSVHSRRWPGGPEPFPHTSLILLPRGAAALWLGGGASHRRCAWWVVWPRSWQKCWNWESRREHWYFSSWVPPGPAILRELPRSHENSHNPARSGFSRGEWSCCRHSADTGILWSLLSWTGFPRTRHLGKSLLLGSVLPEKQGKKTGCGEQVGGAWLRRLQPLAKLTARTYGASAPKKREAVHLRRVSLEGACIAQSQLLLVKDGPMG